MFSARKNVFLLVCYLMLSGVGVTTGESIRINGHTASTGRIEVKYGGQWGTVCGDNWDINDAHVVCRQLGFPKATQAYSGATHGQGTGPIWISNVACSGSESHLYDCRHNGCGNNGCSHSNDASVSCSYGSPNIRLMGGGRNYGRVEIFYHGVWNTVCDDTWDMNDAKVACHQLGYSGATSAAKAAAYGQGSGHILRRQHLDCTGSEASLLYCPYSSFDIGHCSHAEDAGVVCSLS